MAKAFLRADIHGAKEVARAIRRMGSDPELTRELRAANKKVANIFVDEIRRQAPRSDRLPPPKHLADTVSATASRTSAKIKVGGKKYPHAYFVQSKKGYHPGGGKKKVKGNRFMRKAISKRFKKAMRTYPKALEPVIRKFNRRYGYPHSSPHMRAAKRSRRPR